MQKTDYFASSRGNTLYIILSSLIIIGMAVYLPIISIMALALLILFGIYLKHPSWVYMIVIGTFSLSMDKIFRMQMMGFDASSFYKLLILFFILPIFMRYGLKKQFIYPALVVGYLFVQSYFLSVMPSKMSPLDPFKAFLGLVVPFLLLMVNFPKEVSKRIIRVLAWLPVFSLIGGLILQQLGMLSIANLEGSGVSRLQGANIAAHLGMLCFISICVCLMEIRYKNQVILNYALTLTHFIILIQTGTRGPLLALIPIVGMYLIDHVRKFVKGRTSALLPVVLFLAAVSVMVVLQWDNYELRQESKGLSGRDSAWAFFIKKANEYPIFGQGLGSALVANDGSIFSGFTVPHNEYIRFYYDGGLVGALLIFGALLFVYKKVYNKLNRLVKPYFVGMIVGFSIYSFVDNTLSTIHLIAPFCVYLNALYQISDEKRVVPDNPQEFVHRKETMQ
ncbi:O-antigen ligase [Paenibacillus amylolyticus]|uniref:O-antigen ligase family protein n=1 Tax=Paenibacillus amylolyticus TaxID=1451 RepID=UPI000FDC7F17|nr:O-antigen ligase family protein [Paenibacillus amylolyticus]WFA82913.1 O-antigen ligase family protein [Paenibacillus amylolyticus]